MKTALHLGMGTAARLVFLALSLSACDAAFAPSTESETEFFAVYGYLDTEADTQFVRISPLRPLLDRSSQPLDVRVATTLLDTGGRVAWRDSLLRLDDGDIGLLFFAPFHAQPGGRYRLEVRRSDDRLTQAVTRVPPAPSLVTDAVTRAANADFVQAVTWTGVTQRPARTTLRYRISLPGGAGTELFILPFDEPGAPGPDGWKYTVNLSQDRFAILKRLDRLPTDSTVVLLDLHMEIEARSEEWLRTDAPLNIQNGFGFFGAVATFEQTWTPTPAEIVQAGFAAPPSGSATAP